MNPVAGDLPLRLIRTILIVWLVLVGCAVTPVTQGFLLDRDASHGNTIQAGSFDGALSETGPATQNSTVDEGSDETIRDSWEDYGHTNGTSDPVRNTIDLENFDTTLNVSAVTLTVTYEENDSALLEDDDAGQTAASLNLTQFSYGGANRLPGIDDVNGNGQKDLDDMSQQTVTLAMIPANESTSLTMEIAGDADTSGSIGGDDGLDFTLRVTFVVDPSWEDTVSSVNNTIQYESL